jgi:DNA-directed RNA polymerase
MSNNGAQHLSALTRDEITAPHVNLVPSELPGDLYAYIAEHVWTNLAIRQDRIPKDRIKWANKTIDTIIDLKNQIKEAPIASERRKELIDEIKKFKETNEAIMDDAGVVFWNRVTSQKERRKIAKR